MKAKELPPVELLRERFDYDPATGKLTNRVSRGKTKKGNEAGWITNIGYRRVTWGKTSYPVHRICWALHYGEDPHPWELDHINRDKLDNRIDNLRKVTRSENVFNSNCSHNNACGHRGIHYYKRKKSNHWGVQINSKFIGYYPTLEEALHARREAEIERQTNIV